MKQSITLKSTGPFLLLTFIFYRGIPHHCQWTVSGTFAGSFPFRSNRYQKFLGDAHFFCFLYGIFAQ